MTTISAAKAKKLAGCYNATAVSYDAVTGAKGGVEAVQLNDAGEVIRGCGMWTCNNGTPAYTKEWNRRHELIGQRVEILRDGCRAYLAALGMQVKG